MKRRGAILLMTLLLIAIMSGGIALILSESDHLLRLSEQSRSDAQISKIASDLKRLLPRMLSKITTAHDLEYAMMLPLSSRSADGRFILDASLHSPLGRFNINNVCDATGKPREVSSVFLSALFTRYRVAEPETFINILYDTIDTDLAERQRGSEVAAVFPDFHNGSVENFAQFTQVLARYLALTKDRQILAIPWERLIGFEGDKIDINYASPELLSLIVPELDTETIHRITDLRAAPFESKEQLLSNTPQLSSVYDTWFLVYTPGSSYPLIADVAMQTNGTESTFSFHTDTQNRTFNRLEITQ
ncbi:MAG: type II secretion system protein GspK [Sulfuricurvum sp.]|uniref:type II secretion system protein GspK n=1 Tax=Sulfuricurvum sp. TaxID=2025608 RepID=UPI00261E8511|nr:type II secretion system protein GspK [Sulfuricurvum sp.]MDD5158771.1 type II secretion system protein GspK [Sulfuricurvum sp.]